MPYNIQSAGFIVGIAKRVNMRIFGIFIISVGLCLSMSTKAEAEIKPVVTGVSPSTANLFEETKFTIRGSNLTNEIVIDISDCGNSSYLSGDSSAMTFSCKPTKEPSLRGEVRDYNRNELMSFTVDVKRNKTQVTDIIPKAAFVGENTTFTVVGSNLYDDTIWDLPDCGSGNRMGGNTSTRTFSCTPKREDSFSGTIRDKNLGVVSYIRVEFKNKKSVSYGPSPSYSPP